MDLKEFYTSQSEEVKERLKACKSVEEMKQVLDEEGIELDPEMLDNISGGMDQINALFLNKEVDNNFNNYHPSWC